MLCYVMLCYVMLCYVMLCYVMLCYVMLCYVMLCYVMLCYVMLCYVMLCYVMLCYDERNQFKLKPIFEKFEAYTKPQSNQILSRYQLGCLKQDDMPLEEFLTKALTLIDSSGYDPAFKDETLRDTLIFGLKSDKVRKDAISKGHSLTFQQVYDLAKTEESTRAQMQVIRQGDLISELHSVRSKKKAVLFEGSEQAGNSKKSHSKNDFKNSSSASKPKPSQI